MTGKRGRGKKGKVCHYVCLYIMVLSLLSQKLFCIYSADEVHTISG